MKNELFELYTLAELSYQKHFENIVSNQVRLYPVGWYENDNYKEKIAILAEAIKTNRLIVNTIAYQNIVEGVEPKELSLKKD